MTMEDDPSLENALDGLMDAASYADQRISDDLCYRISELYQEVGQRAPASDWDEQYDEDTPIEEL